MSPVRIVFFVSAWVVGCSGAPASEIPPSDTSSESGGTATSTEPALPEPSPAPPSGEETSRSDGKPKAACVVEVEGNDSADKATPFTSCIEGRVSGARDTDYLRIVAPPRAKTMLIQHEETGGKISYRVFRESDDWGFDSGAQFTNAAPHIDVTAGQVYLFRLTLPGNDSGSQSARGYDLSVSFK